ncbi:hypothetical protein EP56_15200 [Listeriaceae bacterium FSL A5-0209]|nr:hypothetical protein EP56_15200 [Listeriaceae bacterium FSL A5-0209]
MMEKIKDIKLLKKWWFWAIIAFIVIAGIDNKELNSISLALLIVGGVIFLVVRNNIKKNKLYHSFDLKTLSKDMPSIELNFSKAQHDFNFLVKNSLDTKYKMVQTDPSGKLAFLNYNKALTNDEIYFCGYKWLGAQHNEKTVTSGKSGSSIVGAATGGILGGGVGAAVGSVVGSSGKRTSTTTSKEVPSKAIFYFWNESKQKKIVTEMEIMSKNIVELERFEVYKNF